MNAGTDMVDWRPQALVIADTSARAVACDAVAASDIRLLAAVGWDAAAERLERQGTIDVVLAETADVPEALLDAVLPRLAAWGRASATRIVVSLLPEQIDLVAAQLHGPHVALLCLPSVLDRAAALALAAVATPGAQVHDVARDAEAVRLRRLTEEVARIAETLARLTRGDANDERGGWRSDSVSDRSLRYAGPPGESGAVDIAPREIRDAIRARRLRDQMFGQGLFEDPAWDMLLDLFAAELERAQVSVSSLCIAAAVAPTTALRWISRMTETGLFERQPDPFDRRRAFMALSPRASAGMRDYVAAVRRAGLAIA